MRSRTSSSGSEDDEGRSTTGSAPRPMSIVHVCRVGWPHRGGMESVVGGLAMALADRGHQVRVITLDRAPRTGEPLLPGVFGGVVYERLHRIGPSRYPMAYGLNGRLRGADIVHVHGVDGLLHQVLAGRSLHGAPVGLTPHGAFLHTDRARLLKAVWLRTGAAAAMRSADAIWFTSQAEREALAPARCSGEVLPDGVDVRAFAEIERSPEPGRWLVMGRVDEHKGLDLLLDRLAAVAQHDERPFRLRVVGPESVTGLVARLRQRAVRLGIGHRVTFVGAVSYGELRMEIARCELALFPSRFEAFGVAIVEAMAAGVPVIANDIPAFREILTDGRDGLLVDFQRSAASQRIRAVRGTLGHLSDPARARAERFGWSNRIAAWENAYRHLLAVP